MADSPIYVTRPTLPPLQDFVASLERLWESRILTNGGPFHEQLEKRLAEFLGVPCVSLFNNGTIALVTALQALDLEGEVITTPYSFVATAHSLLWNRLTPVFVDVDPGTLNLDPARIEAAITAKTSAILPVHCYGIPCDVAAIKGIADRHGLRVAYDAAHAFGVRVDQTSVLAHGEVSVLSFHATKVFNTFEGGAVVCRDAAMKQRIDRLKNFGIVDEETIEAVGSNGKMAEVNAALGLLQLDGIEGAIASRRRIDARYREALGDLPGIRCLPHAAESANHSYFPILVGRDHPADRDTLWRTLRTRNVFARRYFHPLLSELPMYRDMPSATAANLPVATRAAREALCLPIYPGLTDEGISRVINVVRAGL